MSNDAKPVSNTQMKQLLDHVKDQDTRLQTLINVIESQNEKIARLETGMNYLVERQKEQSALEEKGIKICQAIFPDDSITNLSDALDTVASGLESIKTSTKTTRLLNLAEMSLQQEEYDKAKAFFTQALEQIKQNMSQGEKPSITNMFGITSSLVAVQYESTLKKLIDCELQLLQSDPSVDVASHIKELQAFNEKQMQEGSININVKEHQALDSKLNLSLYLQKQYDEALPIYQAAHESDPKDIYTLYILASCQENSGQVEEAKESYNQVLKLLGSVDRYDSRFSSYNLPKHFKIMFGKTANETDENKKIVNDAVNKALTRCTEDNIV